MKGSNRQHNKKETAVALEYKNRENIPTVLERGEGVFATLIVDTAVKNGVPVVRDETLSNILNATPLGCEISPAAYYLAAEILMFLYESDCAWRESHAFLSSFVK